LYERKRENLHSLNEQGRSNRPSNRCLEGNGIESGCFILHNV
jgi:hypothetical protein